MTETLIEALMERLDGKELPGTDNSEARTLFGREQLEKAYRDKVRIHGTILRAILESERRKARVDNTIVPAEPMTPAPVDRWAWVRSGLKASLVGASLTLHVIEAAGIVWLALEVLRPH